jgi:hypothetical protein
VFCPRCQREVVSYSVSRGAARDEDLAAMRAALEAEGKLVLWNPPPCPPWRCPRCRGSLAPAAPEAGAEEP